MNVKNIFDGIPSELGKELFTTIHTAKKFRLERIVSHGQCSPQGFWYDQNENEWLIVLEGNASIQFDGDPESVELHPGSYLNIPAHVKHRLARTSQTQQTVWLAIHYED
ncbi:MAG: cupin domain-containing protein [Thermoguttaceae bacterium]|jgi:cupin 2 domain-containing protein